MDFTLVTHGIDLQAHFNPMDGNAVVTCVGLDDGHVGYFTYDSILSTLGSRHASVKFFGMIDCKPLDVSGLELTGVVDYLDSDLGNGDIKFSTGGKIAFYEDVSSLGVEAGTSVKFNLSADDRNFPIAINVRPL